MVVIFVLIFRLHAEYMQSGVKFPNDNPHLCQSNFAINPIFNPFYDQKHCAGTHRPGEKPIAYVRKYKLDLYVREN